MSELSKRGKRVSGVVLVLSTLVTTGLLFVAQEWYRTYSEINALAMAPDTAVEAVDAKRAQLEQLRSGPEPIERALEQVAGAGRARLSLAALRPMPSTDPGPAAGWMHAPGYQAPPDPAAVIETDDDLADGTGEGVATAAEGAGSDASEANLAEEVSAAGEGSAVGVTPGSGSAGGTRASPIKRIPPAPPKGKVTTIQVPPAKAAPANKPAAAQAAPAPQGAQP